MHKYLQAAMILLAVFAAATVEAAEPNLSFQPAESGYFAFDTGLFRGKVRANGQIQGVSSIVDVPSGTELLSSVGVMSYYRLLATGARYGENIRDWPITGRVLDGGALELRFPATAEHPMEVTGTFRWRSADTLDLETKVKTDIALPRMEVFLSSYFAKGFDALVCVPAYGPTKGKSPLLTRVDWCDLLTDNYVMFPTNRESLLMIHDGRWEVPPSPVTWAFLRYLAAPIAVRRNAQSGVSAVLMSSPKDCFAVSMSYNKTPPDLVASHNALYMSLFGRDLAAGQTATAHCRLILGKDLNDETILKRYQDYLVERSESMVGSTDCAPTLPTGQ